MTTIITFVYPQTPTEPARGIVEVRPLFRTPTPEGMLLATPGTAEIVDGGGSVSVRADITEFWQFHESLIDAPDEGWRTYLIPDEPEVLFNDELVEVDPGTGEPLPLAWNVALAAETEAREDADETLTDDLADTDADMAALDLALADVEDDVTALTAYQAWLESNLLTVGEETIPRETIGVGIITQGTGTLRLRYFTARKTETVTQLRLLSGTTAAAPTPTLCRAAIFSVAGNGDLTQVGIIANDTSLFAAQNTAYTRALIAPFGKVAGQRYALGVLVISGATTPTIVGESLAAGLVNETAIAPRIAGSVSAQTDILASYTAGQVNAVTTSPYGVLLP